MPSQNNQMTPEEAQKRLNHILKDLSDTAEIARYSLEAGASRVEECYAKTEAAQLEAKQSLLELFRDVIGEVIEAARVDGMFIEWNGLNLADIEQMKTTASRYFPVDGGGEK